MTNYKFNKTWDEMTLDERLVAIPFFTKDAKNDEDWDIRRNYYIRYPDDTDAKKDEYWEIRWEYYHRYPDDSDAKNDEDEDVRRDYYRRHPDDSDAKKDEDEGVRNIYETFQRFIKPLETITIDGKEYIVSDELREALKHLKEI